MAGTGLIIVVSAPSGTGKSTLLNSIRERNGRMRFSVSATTRAPRAGEENGKSYHFKTRSEFEEMIASNSLVEWDEYCGNYYGTPREYIDASAKEGYDIILDITVEGALKMKQQYPESILIFVVPPSFEELKRRIEKRGSETPESLQKRLDQAKHEIEYINHFDYMVFNDDIGKAVGDMECILTAERMKVVRNAEKVQKLGHNQ